MHSIKSIQARNHKHTIMSKHTLTSTQSQPRNHEHKVHVSIEVAAVSVAPESTVAQVGARSGSLQWDRRLRSPGHHQPLGDLDHNLEATLHTHTTITASHCCTTLHRLLLLHTHTTITASHCCTPLHRSLLITRQSPHTARNPTPSHNQ